jgi:hypothetical protein
MNKQIFEKHITKLERALKPLSPKEEERDGKVDVYYERLKDADEYLFSKAVKLLQETYQYKSFPLISEILAAIGTARDEMIVQDDSGSECDSCQETGWVIRNCSDEIGRARGYTIAVPCRHCSAGRAVKKACTIKDKHLKKRKALKKISIVIKEATESLPDAELF